METKESNNTNLALVSKLSKPVTDVLSLDFINNYEPSIKILTDIVASKKIKKVVTVQEAMTYYIKSKELGLPFITSIDHMFDVSGKTNMDVHAMRAMVLRAGTIKWDIIYNNVPLYKYIDSTGRVIATGVNSECLPTMYIEPVGNNESELSQDVTRIKSIGKIPVFRTMSEVAITNTTKIFNYATKYKFTRQLVFPDNKIHELIEYGEFSIAEAIYAGLHLTKDNSINLNSPWLIYHRNMLEHRAWTFGARKIADDILFGLLERTEYLDMEKIPYDIVDGKVNVVEADIN